MVPYPKLKIVEHYLVLNLLEQLYRLHISTSPPVLPKLTRRLEASTDAGSSKNLLCPKLLAFFPTLLPYKFARDDPNNPPPKANSCVGPNLVGLKGRPIAGFNCRYLAP